jgi:hypothetical protein
MMRNPVHLVSPDDVDEEEIDPMDLAPLESSTAPIVTVPAEAEEEAEDASEDEIIPALESDHSTVPQKMKVELRLRNIRNSGP